MISKETYDAIEQIVSDEPTQKLKELIT